MGLVDAEVGRDRAVEALVCEDLKGIAFRDFGCGGVGDGGFMAG